RYRGRKPSRVGNHARQHYRRSPAKGREYPTTKLAARRSHDCEHGTKGTSCCGWAFRKHPSDPEFPPLTRLSYSARSAVAGSILVARRAGAAQAASAIIVTTRVTRENTCASEDLTSKSRLCKTRVIADAAARPVSIPTSVGLSPCAATILIT